MMKRLFVIAIPVLLCAHAASASTRSYLRPDPHAGRADLTTITESICDSIVTIRFTDACGDSVPDGFVQSCYGLDTNHSNWVVTNGVWVLGVDSTLPIDEVLDSIMNQDEVVLANPVLAMPSGCSVYLKHDISVRVDSSHTAAEVDSVASAFGLALDTVITETMPWRRYMKSDNDGLDLLATCDSLLVTGFVTRAQFGWSQSIENTQSAIPNDTYFEDGVYTSGQWYWQNNVSGADDHDVDADSAWNITLGSSDVIIAFLDAGYDLTHPDFASLTIYNEFDAAGASSIILDDSDSDVQTQCDAGNVTRCWHATATTSMIFASINNQRAITGLAPSCKLMPVKHIADAGGELQDVDIIAALRHIRTAATASQKDSDNDNIQVQILVSTNNNWFQDDRIDEEFALLEAEGVLTINSAGNDIWPSYPATLSTVHSVSMTDYKDERIPFLSAVDSNLGYVAPGYGIVALDLPGDVGVNPSFSEGYCPNGPPSEYYGDVYCLFVGSSMAASIVAGVAALVYSYRPDLIPLGGSGRPETIIEILDNSSEDQVGPPDEDSVGYDWYYGHGRVNALRALKTVSNGDVDLNGLYNFDDVVGVVGVAFRGETCTDGGHANTCDVNCDDVVDVFDVVWVVDFAFRNGTNTQPPCFAYLD